MNVSTTFTVILHISQNSTIFRTYESDLDSISSKLGFSKRSFADWKTQVWQSFEDAGKGLKGFKEALHTAFTVPKDIKLISETDFANFFPVNDAKDFFDLFNQKGSESVSTLTHWCDEIGVADDTMRSYLTECMQKQVPASFKGYKQYVNSAIESNQKFSLSAKAASVGMKALSLAGNMVAIWAISKGIEWIFTAIDNYVHRIERIKEAAAEAKTEINNIKSDFDNLKSSTEDVSRKFAELAQGVENLGKANQSRGKLSTEDYDEFLDLSNQLAELYPQLTKGYDDNGNAILNLSGNVDTIVGSLNNLLALQQKISNQQILEKLPDVWAGYDVNIDEYTEKLGKAKRNSDVALDAISQIENRTKNIFKTFATIPRGYLDEDYQIASDEYALIYKAFKNIDIIPSYITRKTEDGKLEIEWGLENLTDTQIEQLKNELGRLSSEYHDEMFKFQNDIMASNSEMSSYINTWLSTEWNFVHLDSSLQDGIKDILINFDWTKAIPEKINSGDWDAVSNWLSQDFLYAIQNINSDEIKQSLSKAFSDALSFEEIQKLIDTLKNDEGFDKNNPLVLYFQAKVDAKNELIGSAKARVQDEYKDNISKLSDEDLQIAANLTVSDGDLLSWDELKSKIEEAKITSDIAADSFDNISEKIAQIQENTSDTVANIKIFNDAIDKVNNGENLSYDEVSELLKLDPSLASNFTKTVDGYSIAIDELIAANDRIKGVSSSNIEQNITDTTQKIADSEARIKKLNEERQKLYAEINANKGNEHYNSNETYERLLDIDEEIENLTNSIKNGQDLLSALQITFGEISETASTIQQISLSDLSSSYDLLNSVTKEFNKNGNITVSTLESITNTYPRMKSVVDQYLQGLIDENELIEQLSNAYKTDEDNYYKYLLLKLGYEEDYINEAFEGDDSIVDYYAENYKTDLTNFKDYIRQKQAIQESFDKLVGKGVSEFWTEEGGYTNKFINLQDDAKVIIDGIIHEYQEAMDNLDLDFQTKGEKFEKDLEGIKSRTYSALNAESDSKSSGSSSEFSKTFNWVEIAIEKVSKAASKLGNIVSNTFKSWTDRNSALKKQIKEVNKEIELQQQAYDVYTQKANSVGLSDYWTNKIRNGSIDISVITDEDLADKIDEFKEWYLKMPLYPVTGGGILFNC